MKSRSSCCVDLMIFCLIVIYVGAYFMPEFYGVKCTEKSAPLASLVLCIFYMFWTFYTVRKIKRDPLLDLKHETYTSMFKTAWRLSLKEYEGPFDHKEMVKAQR